MKYSPEVVLQLAQGIHRNDEDFIEGDITERIFQADEYELTTVCPQFLDQEWDVNEDLVSQYMEMDPTKCPPVIILKLGQDLYTIIDGSHRIESFKRRGISAIPAFLGVAVREAE